MTFDVNAQIAQLFTYPVKSCAGIEMTQAVLTETGLDLDRAWMVVDEAGEFVSQRELPRMALIAPQLKTFEMVLRASGMLALHIQIDAVEKPMQVRVWDSVCEAYDIGDLAGQWLTDFLGTSHGKLRLVRFDPEHQRLSHKKWTAGVDAPTQFADGFALLVTSTASMDGLNARLTAGGHAAVGVQRMRPNIVLKGLDAHDEDRLDALLIEASGGLATLPMVKPCTRCSVPNVDPLTGHSSPEVGDALQAYRANPLFDGALTFGMNAIVTPSDDDVVLRVGQTVRANYRFE